MIQGGGEGKDPMPTDPSVCGFEADNTIENSGNADGAPGIGSQRAKTHICSYGSTRPTARAAARDVSWVPGVADGAVVGIHHRSTSKLVQV